MLALFRRKADDPDFAGGQAKSELYLHGFDRFVQQMSLVG